MSDKTPDPEREELYKRTYTYAALQDSFAPLDALSWAAGGRLPNDLHLTAEILSMLRPHCVDEIGTDHAGVPRWIMRPAARHYALDEARIDLDLVASFATDLAQARLGRGAYATDALDALIRAGDASPDLARLAGTLDRAGPHAPGADRVTALRALMNQAEAQARTEALLARGFAGREAELDAIAAALSEPQTAAPVRAVAISGLAGIGKSSLLDYALERARLTVRPVIVRLDFDRAGLEIRDARSFYEEISRQVGDAMPDLAAWLRDRRLAAAPRQIALTQQAPQEAHSFGRSPLDALIAETMEAINRQARLLLVALDTMEVLRAEGESRIALLFERLDRLLHLGLNRIAVLAAGRGRFMDPAPDRILGERLVLNGLEDHDARALLAGEGVPEMLWPDILRLAQGNPLFLRLAARAAPGGDLTTDDLSPGAPPEAVAGVLYRAILSRLPADLRELAAMGLLLREISQESLHRVIAPTAAPEVPQEDLDSRFQRLTAHRWLVRFDPVTGLMHHDEDVRQAFLPLLYTQSPRQCAEIDARAARYFEEAGRPGLALYHRLQLTREGGAVPDIAPEAARALPPEAARDLPPAARDALRQAQGMRSDFARAGEPESAPIRPLSRSRSDPLLEGQGPLCRFDTARDRLLMVEGASANQPDPRALRDLERSLIAHDLREAEFILQNGLAGDLPADSPGARLILCHLWLTGRWSSALRLFRAQPETALQTALTDAPALEGRILLDMAAEFRFDDLADRLRDDSKLKELALTARLEGGRAGLSGAALDMALLTALPEAELPRQQLDMAIGLWAQHGGQDWQAGARLRALARAERARRGLDVAPEAADRPDPQELAILNPYARRQMAMLLRPPRGALSAFLDKAQDLPRLAAAHYLPNSGDTGDILSGPFPTPRDLLRALHGMGLAAEWAEGFTLFHPVADLPLLAHSTERWRRLAAGDWPYGRARPSGWRGAVPDLVTRARAERLLTADDTGLAARDRLYLWSRFTHSPEAAARHLRNRFEARYRRCLDTLPKDALQARLDQALQHFHATEVTSIAASPLSVLAARGITPSVVFAPPD